MTQDPRERVEQTYSGIVRWWAKSSLFYTTSEFVAFFGQVHARRRQAVDALALEKGARVLELGCGTGRNFPYIESSIGPSGSLVGLDSSHEMLGAAKRLCEARDWRNVKLVQGEAGAVGLEQGDFDGVLSVLAVNGLLDAEAVLRCAHAALRPGGRYVVCDIQPFAGRVGVLNPLLRPLSALIGWDAQLNIPAALHSTFDNVHVDEHAAGALFVATARRST